MKKPALKAIALLLAALSLLSCTGAFALAAENEAIPTVYIQGQGHTLKKVEGDESSEQIYPLEYDLASYVPPVIEELNPVFAKAYITGDYTEYCNVICNAVEPIFAEIQIAKNGEVADGSGVPWSWPACRLSDRKVNGEYDLDAYNFIYDWRVDPCTTADGLNAYINEVLEVTGAEKVNIVSRCLGSNVYLAYLYEYGDAHINKCVIYVATIEGTAACSKTFSGQIVIDPDGAERYAYDKLGDDTLMEFLKSSVALLNRTQGLNLAADFVDSVYQQVKPEIVPRLLKMTYGGFPAYWSMVGAEDYEVARELVFGDCKEEYAGLIEKIDHYHYDIQANAHKLLKESEERGVETAVICKYGVQIVPIAPNSDDIGDGIVELNLASLGATTSKVNNTLGRKYLKDAEEKGTAKYISPDKQVDASTCLFPDTTWIIKGVEHKYFPACIDTLIEEFLAFNGKMTVSSKEQFPQYLGFDEESEGIAPLVEENADDTNWNTHGIIGVIVNFFAQLGKVIKEYLIPLIKDKLQKSK